MVVRKYPADHGHTTVINNLCLGLKKLGYKTAIGAFSFQSNPPHNIKQVNLSKIKLLTSGINYLDYDIIHTHQAFPNYFLLSIKPKKPVVLHYHGASNRIQRINFKIFMAFYRKRIDKIISVSKTGISQMKDMVGNISAEVIYNGVDINFYNPELPKPFKKGNPQLLFVSALRPYKNTSMLISSMPDLLKKYPDAHLQIVGKGDDYINLKNLIKQKYLQKNVELVGQIDNDELKLRYSSCDLYVSASTFEVCPVPTLEAMACGKPLVLSDIEPQKEMIDISDAGVEFVNYDHTDFVKKIDQVFKTKDRLGIAARKFAENLDWNHICRQVANVYENF